ncbi:hypothetical protein MUP46_00840 [Patescibacteria group bacterium]|nr:hypothetical protein [Patescibacteria group bacterium]
MKTNNRTLIRYIFAIFFILCGLIICIGGSYIGFLKHYNGKIPLVSSMASKLMIAYPDEVWKERATKDEPMPTILRYSIRDTKLLDLPYTTEKHLLWLAIPIGLAYVILGVAAFLKEGSIFRKD